MIIKIINTSSNPLPEYKTPGSAGLDLSANLEETIILKPLERVAIPTGIFIEIPIGYEGQIRPRSGLSLKEGVTAILGTIDSDYRGEIKIIVVNLSNVKKKISSGERIAQIVFSEYAKATWQEVESLETTERGTGGFGSTGK